MPVAEQLDPFPANPDDPIDISDFEYIGKLHLVRHDKAPAHHPKAQWQLTKDYTVTFRLNGVETRITAPRGFYTDLSSVPWLFRWYVSQVGPHLEASIIHDYLHLAWTDFRLGAPRRADHVYADKVMLAGMQAVESIGWLKRTLIYAAVRSWFGWRAFSDEKEKLSDRMALWLKDLDEVGIP